MLIQNLQYASLRDFLYFQEGDDIDDLGNTWGKNRTISEKFVNSYENRIIEKLDKFYKNV